MMAENDQPDLAAIAQHFVGVGAVHLLLPMSTGHVNATWKVSATGGDFVLQRLNAVVFPDPNQAMANALTATTELQAQSFPLKVPEFLPTQEGLPWHWEAGCLWRLYPFISAAPPQMATEDPAQAHSAGLAFGRFLSAMVQVPLARVPPAIPGFFDLKTRLAALDAAIKADKCDRLHAAQFLLDEIDGQQDIVQGMMRIKAPFRVVHNDAKLANALFAPTEHSKAIAIIDFDTVMPGLALYDFGDLVRSCTDAAPEDVISERLSKEALQAVTRGYLEGGRTVLTGDEIHSLQWGPVYVTFLLTLRFLTDFLEGDKYFKVQVATHNLRRAQTQFRRFRCHEAHRAYLSGLLASNS